MNTTMKNGNHSIEVKDGTPLRVEMPDQPGSVSGHLPAMPHAPSASRDPLARLRNRMGDRLPSSYAYSLAPLEEYALEDTPLKEATEVIGEVLPGRASELAGLHRRVANAFATRGKVTDDEYAKLAMRNRYVRARNAEVDSHQVELTSRRDAAVSADCEELAALDEPLTAAHREAAEKVARAGGCYDPATPSDSCVLLHSRRPLEAIAADLGLPWGFDPKKAVAAKALSWVCTVLVGMMIGLSVGIMGGFLNPMAIWLNIDTLALFVVLGIGISVVGKLALQGWGHVASEWFHMGNRAATWLGFLVPLTALAGLILIGDGAAERSGLLARLQHETLIATGHQLSSSDLTYWLVPILATLGYVGSALWLGWVPGRAEPVRNRLVAIQEKDFSAADAEARQRPEVRDALHALARVRTVQAQRILLEHRIGETVHPFQEKIQWWESRRMEEQWELDEHARKLIQDANDDLTGTDDDFQRLLRRLLDEVEPLRFGFWGRLWWTLSGWRAKRRTRRETRGKQS